ncbi:MAG TPA: ribokinase [Acidobacteriaceae bacterium]
MSIAQKPIVVVGSINIDLVANADRIPAAGETLTGSDFQIHHGGKGANQAVAAARLGYPVQMIGRVGDDAFGSQLRDGLSQAGVDANAVAVSKGSSGVAVIIVAASGENSIVVIPGANAQVTPEDLDANIEIIRSAGIVLAQLEIPLDTVLHLSALCEREGVPLMLDPAPARPLPPELLRRVAWFTPNETEAAAFAHSHPGEENEKTAQSLREQGIAGVVLKLGARGAYLAASSGERHVIAPFPVKAVDTTAAGDCFNGAFAVALLSGSTPQESARFAAAAAAISVTRPGAQPSMPTMAEVRALLKAHPEVL